MFGHVETGDERYQPLALGTADSGNAGPGWGFSTVPGGGAQGSTLMSAASQANPTLIANTGVASVDTGEPRSRMDEFRSSTAPELKIESTLDQPSSMNESRMKALPW